jgi:hypothetical protein
MPVDSNPLASHSVAKASLLALFVAFNGGLSVDFCAPSLGAPDTVGLWYGMDTRTY